MDMNDMNIQQNSTPEKETPTEIREYSKTDITFFILSFLLFFVAAHFMPFERFPLGALLFFFVLFPLTFVYLRKNGSKKSKSFVFITICIALPIFGLVITSDNLIRKLILAYSFIFFTYQAFVASSNSDSEIPNDAFLFEAFKASVIMPFGSFFCGFEALAKIKGAKKALTHLRRILLGLAIAIIPSVIILALLSYDSHFNKMIRELFIFDTEKITDTLRCIVIGIIGAMYLFGLVYSCTKHRFANILGKDDREKAAKKTRCLPISLVCATLSPIILIYLIFFASQIEYHFSAFKGILPDGAHSYSNYAVRGFFELCSVSAINAVILCLAFLLCRPSEDDKSNEKESKGRKTPVVLKIFGSVLAVVTLVIILLAMSKMLLYINMYGLTRKRVLSSWFMILLALAFTAGLLKMHINKFKLFRSLICIFFVMLLAVSLCDIGAVISNYNTDRYLDGSLKHIDYSSYDTLGDAGIVGLDRLARESDSKIVRISAESRLKEIAKKRSNDEKSVFSISIPSLKAERILQNYK